MNPPSSSAPATVERVYDVLKTVMDPEIPTLSIFDLGIIRDVQIAAEKICVTITPTYSGCPAMKMIEDDIRDALGLEFSESLELKTVLAPAWSTEWITEEGRQRLRESGVTPPLDELVNLPTTKLTCPFCGSTNTRVTSTFGSTACKSLCYCDGCQQPFEYFKPL